MKASTFFSLLALLSSITAPSNACRARPSLDDDARKSSSLVHDYAVTTHKSWIARPTAESNQEQGPHPPHASKLPSESYPYGPGGGLHESSSLTKTLFAPKSSSKPHPSESEPPYGVWSSTESSISSDAHLSESRPAYGASIAISSSVVPKPSSEPHPSKSKQAHTVSTIAAHSSHALHSASPS